MRAEITSAMSSPAQLGAPVHEMPVPAGGCQKDSSACPLGWRSKGVLCYAGASYAGPCAPVYDQSDMSEEARFAFARQCKVEFPCQGDCVLDFRSACPSAWRQTEQGACAAPASYAGDCNPRLDAQGMSNADKQAFGVQCGARWPCLPQRKHIYASVCPQGWDAQPGQVCNAPTSYSGPCDKVAYMGGVTVRGKKEFEASCEVSWPAASS